jgi:hypothetical protein
MRCVGHLLRRHEAGRSEDDPGAGGVHGAGDDPGDPEVEDLDPHLERRPGRVELDHDVVGLEITMDDAKVVGVLQRAAALEN